MLIPNSTVCTRDAGVCTASRLVEHEFRGGNLGFLRQSWIDNVYLISMYVIYGDNDLYHILSLYDKLAEMPALPGI